jgi:hypothetical protein
MTKKCNSCKALALNYLRGQLKSQEYLSSISINESDLYVHSNIIRQLKLIIKNLEG